MAAVKRIRVELDRSWVLAVAAGMASPRVARVTRRILNRSRVLTPVRTGNLRASQYMTMRVRRTYVAGTVETRVKYAIFVHDATSPHLIWARRAKYLRFEAPTGVVHYRKFVRHPGTKGQPFLRQAMTEEAPPEGFQVRGFSAASGNIGFGLTI